MDERRLTSMAGELGLTVDELREAEPQLTAGRRRRRARRPDPLRGRPLRALAVSAALQRRRPALHQPGGGHGGSRAATRAPSTPRRSTPPWRRRRTGTPFVRAAALAAELRAARRLQLGAPADRAARPALLAQPRRLQPGGTAGRAGGDDPQPRQGRRRRRAWPAGSRTARCRSRPAEPRRVRPCGAGGATASYDGRDNELVACRLGHQGGGHGRRRGLAPPSAHQPVPQAAGPGGRDTRSSSTSSGCSASTASPR